MTMENTVMSFDEDRAQEWNLIQWYISAVLCQEKLEKLDCEIFKMAYRGGNIDNVDIDALQEAIDEAQAFAENTEKEISVAIKYLEEQSPLALNRAILIGNLNHGSKYFKVSAKAPKEAVEKLQEITNRNIGILHASADHEFAKIGKADIVNFRDALNECAKAHDKKSGLNRSQAEAMFFGMADVKTRWNNAEERDYKIADIKIKGRSAIDTAVRTLVASKLQESYRANMNTVEGQQWTLVQE